MTISTTQHEIVQLLLAHGGRDDIVVARTPHGTYTFDIAGVVRDLEGRICIQLEEIKPEPPKPCGHCGRERSLFPAIFQNDEGCSVLCQKALAKRPVETEREVA